MIHETNVLIVGAGVAGLTAALNLADTCKVTILCKSILGEGASLYAQGGIAAVMDKSDSLESHIQDTVVAGAGLCDKNAVRFTVENAKSCIDWLINQEVHFTLDNDDKNYHLTMEGGHSHRRILHSEDATGKELQTKLVKAVKRHYNIEIFEYYNVIDLILKNRHCIGAYAFNSRSKLVETFAASAVIIASGGASCVYQYSTNPVSSSGDGIAIAYRAGCRVANLEFNQFHPTCLYYHSHAHFLLSEALRGEGAYLRLPNGERFMLSIDERAELAPRDIVARSIDFQMKSHNIDHIYLDITHKSAKFIKEHFPMIYQKLLTYNFDLTRDQIPVVPAAHYTCGGIMVDNRSRTDIKGLYAAGEAAYTGLHGANRMASNSLLECLVYAFAAANDIKKNSLRHPSIEYFDKWKYTQKSDLTDEIFIRKNCLEVRRCMSDFMGIVRSNKSLARAKNRITLLEKEVFNYYSGYMLTTDLLELRNLVLISKLMINSALKRKESRGLHFTFDYRQESKHFLKPTVLFPEKVI